MRALHSARSAVTTAAKRHSAIIGSTVSIKTSASRIVLTFDDGPNPPITEGMTEVLARYEATATFFVLLTRARIHPSSLAALTAAGHEIALHGVDHRPLTGRSYGSVLESVRRGKEELEDLTGVPVRWFRPPYGAQGARAWLAVRKAGLEPVLWNRSTRDSVDLPDEARVSSATAGAVRGDILLAHDGYASLQDGVDDGPPPDLDRPALLEKVLAEYRRRGLQGCSLDNTLSTGQLVRRAWFSNVI